MEVNNNRSFLLSSKKKRMPKGGRYSIIILNYIILIVGILIFLDFFGHFVGEMTDPENNRLYNKSVLIVKSGGCDNDEKSDCVEYRRWAYRGYYFSVAIKSVQLAVMHGNFISNFYEYMMDCDAACRLHHNIAINTFVTELRFIIYAGLFVLCVGAFAYFQNYNTRKLKEENDQRKIELEIQQKEIERRMKCVDAIENSQQLLQNNTIEYLQMNHHNSSEGYPYIRNISDSYNKQQQMKSHILKDLDAPRV